MSQMVCPKKMLQKKPFAFVVLLATTFFYGAAVYIVPGFLNVAEAARVSDVAKTKHNFSASVVPTLPGGQPRVVSAASETQICIFCHTPHGATANAGPLWNRELSTATYTTYRSGSLDAVQNPGDPLLQPTGSSKLCLSCHDGTIAVGAVNVLDGSFADTAIMMTGTGAGGMMPDGASGGRDSGFTSFIGTDLANDHPISMTYDATLAAVDGELFDYTVNPSTSSVGIRLKGVAPPSAPLLNEEGRLAQVQCNTCHDPHIIDTAAALQNQNIKFLRLSRFQVATPANVPFNPGNPVGTNGDIMCLACHRKAGWVNSAHAHPDVSNEAYTNAAATVREFPLGTQVWESSCLGCHDTHTVQGARHLTREGTDDAGVVINGYLVKQGGDPALEETCYPCHSLDGNTLTTIADVADIKTDYTVLAIHMPITTDQQANGVNIPVEVHNIGDAPGVAQAGKDLIESQARLGLNSPNNRHVECTDCHNPHRSIRNRLYNAEPATPDVTGTHAHKEADLDPLVGHTNIASGVLKGTWGVEPIYDGNSFNSDALSMTYTIKRGNPDINEPIADPTASGVVTREYQVCLKCHSNYAYGNNPPLLGSFGGGTPSNTNGMTRYTNQAREFNAPIGHQGEPASTIDSGAAIPSFSDNNYRSWHPVMRETGRTPSIRGADPTNWITPFNLAVGTQTMYCTDCHGSGTATGTVVPNNNFGAVENGKPWGAHGSDNNFILKGPSSSATGGVATRNHLCFKCHEFDQYANPAPAVVKASGFSNTDLLLEPISSNNLHRNHAEKITNYSCNLCHIAVPHGWKNKAFLVNLNDVGPESFTFITEGNQVRNNVTDTYIDKPYYNKAALKIVNFAKSKNWAVNNCGSAGLPGNGEVGIAWMTTSSEACVTLP